MKHKKYCRIENSYRQKFLNIIDMTVDPDETWFVQEKIHGANLQIQYDGFDFAFGSRNQILDQDGLSKFYHLDLIEAQLKRHVVKLYTKLKSMNVVFDTLILYGELFGGSYPGYNHVDGVSQVQRGVHYTPNLEFMAFDIMLIIDNAYYEQRYLSTTFTKNMLIDCEIPFPKILFQGSLVDCLQYHNDGVTAVPDQLGIGPALTDNIMEGVVIKPDMHWFLKCGSRIILKNKNDKFSEKQKADKVKAPETLSNELQNALDIMATYINYNRFTAVISKLGHEFEPKHIGQVIGLLTKDALDDFWKDQAEPGFGLSKTEMKQFNKHTGRMARDCILANR